MCVYDNGTHGLEAMDAVKYSFVLKVRETNYPKKCISYNPGFGNF